MEPEPPSQYIEFILLGLFSGPIIISVALLCILIVLSALVSGSEVAFFSLTPSDIKDLRNDKTSSDLSMLSLIEEPKRLLATILITNNLINILIIILADFILLNILPSSIFIGWGLAISEYIPFDPETIARLINWLVSVLGVTFFLVLFGELLPKIYANLQPMKLAETMVRPMHILRRIFSPISSMLVGWSDNLQYRLAKSTSSIDSNKKDELAQAIEFSVDKEIYKNDEADLLKGIINFGEVSVKQVMKPRMDIVALDINDDFADMLTVVRSSGFSRLPVFDESVDQIKGILYVKDLLGHTNEAPTFHWNSLIRDNVVYVPETKKIDELLKEFQTKRLHLAIAVDEFGGTSGLVTLEDIMEEIIGEIKDEFDDELEVEYTKIDDYTYIFEGKVLLNDTCRVLDIDLDEFDTVKGNSDSLAGLILEIEGNIPKKNQIISYDRYTFHIVEVSKRRIESVKIVIDPIKEDVEE